MWIIMGMTAYSEQLQLKIALNGWIIVSCVQNVKKAIIYLQINFLVKYILLGFTNVEITRMKLLANHVTQTIT